MKNMAVLFSCILLLFSCKKSSSIQMNGDESVDFSGFKSLSLTQEELDFYNFYNETINGQILIEETNMLSSPGTSSMHIGAYHDNSLSLDDLLINTNTIPEDSENENSFNFDFSGVISGIFGTANSINFGGVYQGQITSPEIILASVSSGAIKAGSALNWNGGEYARGVVVYIDFNPNMQFNSDLRAYNPVSLLLQTEDDGEFVLTDDMFENIPQNAQVTLGIVRGNYKMLTNSSSNCRVLIISRSSGSCIYKP